MTSEARDNPIVHIVDDDAWVRDSLQVLLEVHGLRTRSYAGGAEFLAAISARARGCVLLDLRMPDVDGLEVQAELARREITLPVIVLTAHGDVGTTRAALKSGAFDFIEKPFDDAVLRTTIEAALSRDSEARVALYRKTHAALRLERLTAREREVLSLVVNGKHNREIAAELGISPRTVEVYKARLMDKLHVERLPDLIRLALEMDL